MRPHVVVMSAVSMDGRLASRTGDSRISCPRDLDRLHVMRGLVDAVLVGGRTVRVDNPSLTVRRVPGRNPLRVVVSASLDIPLTSRVLDGSAPTVIFTTSRAPPETVRRMLEMGVRVHVYEGDRVPLDHALEVLGWYGVRRLLVEGGGSIIWQLLSRGLVDEVILTVSGMGLASGTSFLEGEGPQRVEEAPRMRLARIYACSCGREAVLHYVRLPTVPGNYFYPPHLHGLVAAMDVAGNPGEPSDLESHA